MALLLNAVGNTMAWGALGKDEVFGLTSTQVAKDYTAQEIACSGQSNVFWPGEALSFTVQIANQTDKPLKAPGTAQIIAYGTKSDPLDGWTQYAFKIADCVATPITIDLPAKGYVDLVIHPVIPKRFGAYALILDVPGHGRQFGAAFLYVPKATPGKVKNPTYALDLRETTPQMCGLWQRLGIKGTRNEWGYRQGTPPDFAGQMAELGKQCAIMSKYDITAMLTLEGGDYGTMPNSMIRSFLNTAGEGNMQYPGDFVWMPQYDENFQLWTYQIARQFGWPNGPINAVELWNEPWEGISISGWGADMPRYREIYEHMAKGVVEAREKDKTEVLIGGTCSSMNTEDKLFPDGKDTYLKWLDFTSIHYQPMGNVPALIPAWVNRQSPLGKVQPWDTESWIANSEDRVAAVIASMRAQGLSRTAGVLHDVIRETTDIQIRTPTGTTPLHTIQAYPCGAGIAATQCFIGQRDFKELLFKNGLPWVFVFDGLPGADGKANPDDGSVVVVGDLGAVYERNLCKFRNVFGLTNEKQLAQLHQQQAALPAEAPKATHDKLQRDITIAEILTGAAMTLPDGKGAFTLYDFYGNPVPAKKGKISVPLNGYGYFLRTNGTAGSFARLLVALKTAMITGYEPLDMQAQDMTAPLDKQPGMLLTLTNILNRPITGALSVTLGDLTLDAPRQVVSFSANETKSIFVKVIGGTPNNLNSYPLALTYDAGKDGVATLSDTMHVNVIAKRTITVDGKLDDWNGVLPEITKSDANSGPNLTEKAWLPFVNFPDKSGTGVTVAYLAYDDAFFYFAAKVADNTPDTSEVRIATRDDDQYFYPASYTRVENEKKIPMTWPDGIRRYSYRKNPDLPFGGDGVQIAFNVLPEAQKGLIAYPPGTMEKFMVHKDTDYEYYLHPVGAQYGGGAEIWRLLAPGVPRKHFYPRQPKAEIDGGPVTDGKLVVVQDGNNRIVECALPWSEIPDVKVAKDAGQMIKFTFRVTDNSGPTYEMASGRSVSKWNPLTFHAYWESHWSNDIAFGFMK